MNMLSTRRWQNGDMNPNPFTMVRVNTLALDDDGDGLGEVHVTSVGGTLVRFYALGCVRIAASPQKSYPCVWATSSFVHHAKKRGKALLSALLETLLP